MKWVCYNARSLSALALCEQEEPVDEDTEVQKRSRDTTRFSVATEEASTTPGLSFEDGLRFGCGFAIASCLVWLALPATLTIIALVFAVLN